MELPAPAACCARPPGGDGARLLHGQEPHRQVTGTEGPTEGLIVLMFQAN